MLCPLCAKNKAQHNGKKYISKEHIPPQSIFIKNKENLITVPSCNACNAGTSRLDEKFKATLGLYIGRQVPKLWQETLNTLNYRNNTSYKKSVLEQISPIQIKFESFGWGHKAQIEAEPIKAVIKKIARGLHWHVTKEIVPSNNEITVYLLQQRQQAHPEIRSTLKQHGHTIITGGGDFQADYAIVTDRKYSSMWLFRFYNEDCFIAIIHPENEIL